MRRALIYTFALLAPASAAADEKPPPPPIVRNALYMRVALGSSTTWMRSSSDTRSIRSSAPVALTTDIMLGLGIKPYVALGLAYHSTFAGASTRENGTSRSANIYFHMPGVFAHFYPLPETLGWYVGTTLGWGFGTSEVSANGPAFVATTGMDLRAEHGRTVTFGFRFAHSPFLRHDDVRMTATSFGFFLALGIH